MSETWAAAKLLCTIQYLRVARKFRTKDPNWAFCWEMLPKVSRSFATVIEQLGEELRGAVCVFYLVLRALDTVEDDMAIPIDEKLALLREFHNKIEEDGFCLSCGYKEEKELIENFSHVVCAYKSLKPQYQATIKEITQRMAEGMIKYLTEVVVSKADYDLYCHYVAGLVGIGLSKLFSDSGLEDASIANQEDLANHMGLFLQKTNIIRDFLEDHEDLNEETGARRVFWPKEVWSKHTDSLEKFTYGKNSTKAVACLNEMVTDALRHVPYCLEYCSAIEDEKNFVFCVIPQVMAAHTLSLCYNNPKIFEGNIRKAAGECRNIHPVKLRKGRTAKLIYDTTDMKALLSSFEEAMFSIQDRIPDRDPSAAQTNQAVQHVLDVIQQGRRANSPTGKIGDTTYTSMLKSLAGFASLLLNPFVFFSVIVAMLASPMTQLAGMDLPHMVGLEQWPLQMDTTGPWAGVVTLGSFMVYAAITMTLCSSSGKLMIAEIAMVHAALSVVYLSVIVITGAAGLATMAVEALPRVLLGGALFALAKRHLLQVENLTPSHLRRRIVASAP